MGLAAAAAAVFAACGGSQATDPAAAPANEAGAGGPGVVAAASAGDGGDPARGDPDGGAVDAPAQELLLPRTGISAAELGVIVNDSDPLSVSVANYYMTARKIPAGNLVHVQIANTSANAITADEFAPLAAHVDAALAGTKVEALLLTWTKPFAVEHMSITSAFAMGYRAIADTCNDPKSQSLSINPYVGHLGSTRPFDDLAFRPAMTLPATTLAEAQALVDRGVASDDTWPKGSAYLMNTSDQTRSARCLTKPQFGWTNECQTLLDTWDSAGSGVAASIVVADSVKNATDVLFYVQGLASVPDITTNTYLPGAVADHLTSFGGQIPTSGQMSAFVFLQGGATGSYGTVVEPCAYQQKFPDPSVLVPRYFGGNTLIEAYWKSVVWPAEGIFLGEPLARPFGSGFRWTFANGALDIQTTTMLPGATYLVEAADSEAGPFVTVLDGLTVPKYQIASFSVPNATRHTYRFRSR
jgi:uncharacterized protein (TIGR03790 family)